MLENTTGDSAQAGAAELGLIEDREATQNPECAFLFILKLLEGIPPCDDVTATDFKISQSVCCDGFTVFKTDLAALMSPDL